MTSHAILVITAILTAGLLALEVRLLAPILWSSGGQQLSMVATGW
jgi:hypothetical protein